MVRVQLVYEVSHIVVVRHVLAQRAPESAPSERRFEAFDPWMHPCAAARLERRTIDEKPAITGDNPRELRPFGA